MPTDPRDYRFDVTGVANPPAPPAGAASDRATRRPGDAAGSSDAARDRPYLSVLFNCCRAYQRVYRSRDGTAYAGRCLRCGAAVTFRVGEGGTDARHFIVE